MQNRNDLKWPHTKRSRIGNSVFCDNSIPMELWAIILSYITCTTRSFRNLSLVSKGTYDYVVSGSNLSTVSKPLISSLCASGNIVVLEKLYKNPTANFCFVSFAEQAVAKNQYAVLNFLLSNTRIPHMMHYTTATDLFKVACSNKNEDLAILLLQTCFHTVPEYNRNIALEHACATRLFAVVNSILSLSFKELSSEALLNVLINNNIDIARLLINDKRMPLSRNNLLKECCNRQFVEFVQVILNDINSNPLVGPYSFRSLAILQLFINCPRVNITDLFVMACSQQNYSMVKAILKTGRVVPSTKDNSGLINACKSGDVATVQLLLMYPCVDPNIFKNDKFPLLIATKMNDFGLFQALMSDSRVDPTLQDNSVLLWIARKYESHYFNYVSLLLKDKRIFDFLHSKETHLKLFEFVKNHKKSVAIFLLKHTTIHWEEHDILQFICQEYRDTDVFYAILNTSIDVNIFNGLLLRTFGKFECTNLLQTICNRPELEITEALMYEDSYKKMTFKSLLFLGNHPRTSLAIMNAIRCHVVKQSYFRNLDPCFKAHISFNDNEFFVAVCEGERLALAQELLKHEEVDPTGHNNKAIISACMRLNFLKGQSTTLSIIKLLLNDKPVNPRGVSFSEIREARNNQTLAQLFAK